MRYLVVQLPDPRPVLVVETTHDAMGSLGRFKATLRDLGCATGLLFDEMHCLVVRDAYTGVGEDSIILESELPTPALLKSVRGASLDQKVGEWLRRMAADWGHTLPDEPSVSAPLLTDVVPALSGSAITAVKAA